jgi:hypothetical protein
LLAASLSAVGVATLIILFELTSILPVPFASNTKSPFESVDEIVLPSNVMLSTSKEVIPFKSV